MKFRWHGLLALALLSPCAFADTASGVNYLLQNQSGTGLFGEALGEEPRVASAEAVDALRALGFAGSADAAVLALSFDPGLPDTEVDLRRAGVLATTPFALPLLPGDAHALGFDASDALHLSLSLRWLHGANAARAQTAPLVTSLLSLQLPTGCFGHADEPSIEITSLAARALAGESAVANAARQSAFACLAAHQAAGGAIGDLTSTAAALLALRESPTHAVAVNAARAYLMATQLPNGSWENSVRSTALAVQAIGVSSPDWNVDTDVVGRALLLLSDSEPIQGATITASLTLSNRSAFDAPLNNVRFWAQPLAGGVPVLLATQSLPPLAAGSTTVFTAPLPTLALSGRYTLLARVDPDNITPELNELNNAAAALLNVRQENDVAVYSSGIRFTALGGSQVQVQVDIHNLGVVLPRAVDVALYRGNPTSNGTLIGTTTLAAGLATNAQATVAFTWNATSVNGPIPLYAVADASGALSEINETNNAGFRFYTPGADQPVDLNVSALTYSPQPPVKGRAFTANATVRNLSTVEATRVPVGLYEGVLLRALVEVAAIPANGSVTVALGPLNTLSATEYTAVADPHLLTADPNRANNSFSRVTGNPADEAYALSLSSVTPTVTNPAAGTSFTVSVSATNSGTDTAPTFVRLVDTTDGTTWTVMPVSLLANETTSVSLGSFTAPNHKPILRACIDPDDALDELNENDNCASFSMGPGGADLRVHSNNIRFAPYGANVGEAVSATATVRNLNNIQTTAVLEWWHGRPSFEEGQLIERSPLTLAPNASVDVALQWVRQAGAMELYARIVEVLPRDDDGDNNFAGRHLFLESIVDVGGLGIGGNEGTDVRVGRVRGLPAPEIAVAYKFGTAATTSAGVALFEPTANGHQLLWRNEALGYVGDIVLADTDNDGVGEVVYLRSNIANDFPTQVVARRADGSLKWQSPLRAAGCAYPQQLAVGDINGDAVADFAYATATHVRVLSGVDGSEIRLITLAASSTDCSGDQPIELVDVEGDGQNEIVVRDFDGTSLRMFNADGTQRWRVPTGQVIDQVAIADLDQDGFPELLRPRQRAPIIAHDLRTGAQVAISTPFESLPSAPFSVGAARQDGLPYVVIGNNGFTTTGGSFRPDLTALWETTLPSNPTDVLTGTLADLTGAGRPQWISSSFTRAFLMLDARNGTLLEGTPQQLPNVGGTPSLFNGERPPVVADVFGNGKSAIVIGKQGRGIEEWSLPNEYALYGPGQFAIFTSPHWKKQPKVWATRAHVKGRIDESLHVNSTYRWWTDHNTWNQQFDAVPAELRPDLELRQGEFVAAPAQPAAGASSTVSVTLHNVGGVAASNVRVAFYDGNPDSGGRLIGDTVLPGPLAPRTGTAVASLAWTAYPEGSHEIYAVANSDDAIVESGRENNIAFFRVLVGPAAALCDLSIDLASLATTPAVPLPGNATQLSGTVQNVGTIACTATTVELREGASTLGSVALASLAPSATANVSFSFTALPGTRLLQLVADASQVTLDSDRANNLAAFTLFVPSSTTPDLAVADFSLTPNPANPGEGVLGSVTVRNAGGLSGPVALRIRAGSSDIATTSLAPLLPGETTTFAFNLTAPTATTTLEAAIDPANALPELDETNNVASRTLTVQASELSLSCVASPASVGPGESVTFTATAVRTATTSVDVLLDATVLDAQGQAVASLASGQRRTLLTGSTAITFAWNSGNYPAGNYALDVVATAATASTGTTAGRTLARTQIPVTVTAEVLAQTALAVDRASYTPGQEVLMTQRLTNASRNASLDGALLRIFVADSTGTVLFTSLRALSSLPAGATRDTSDLFPISPDLALGTYTSRSEVLNAQGALLASAQTTWTLHYAATDIIVGTLAVPTPFPNNRALDVSAALTNNGSTPLVQGLLVVEVLNGTTLALEASASQRVDVAALGSPSFTLTVPVTGIPEGQKLFVLRLDGRILDRTLALAVQGPNDTEPPVIALTGVNDGLVTLQDVTPVFSATDQSPFTLTATLNGAAFISGTPIITEGDYTLDLAAQDIHGNASSLSVRFAIDRTPPALALTGPQDGEFSATPVTLTFDATDAHPGATTSTLDGNAIASGQSVTTEGTHVWGVTSTDAAGNVATRTVNFTLDFTDPSVRIVGVTSGAYYRTAVAPTVDAADTHLARVDVTLDGAPYVPGTPITTEGAHQLLAQAFDAAGRSASDQVSFVLDFTAPVITVHGVSDGTFVNAPPTIVFFAADAYLANVSATLDGAPFVSGDFVSLAGTHVLVVTAVDLAGNVATRTVTALALFAGAPSVAQVDAYRRTAQAATGDARTLAELQLALSLYARQQQEDITRLYALEAHSAVQDVLEALAGKEFGVDTVNGTPVALLPGLYVIDVARDSLTPLPLNGDSSRVAYLARLAGHHGSALEHKVWENVFPTAAVSAVKILQAAASQTVPVYQLVQGSPQRSLLTGFSASTLNDIDSALGAGWRARIAQRPISYAQYQNQEGYILENPATGAGAYRINALLNGGGSKGGGNSDGPEGPECACDEVAGSRINVALGNWRESFTDLSLPGVGLPISFGRTYASKAQGLTPLGYGWMHTYSAFLRAEPDGDMTFVMQDFREARFNWTGTVFTAPPEWPYTLTRAGTDLRLRYKDGLEHLFNAQGRLLSIREPSGNIVTLTYSGGLPVEVRDSDNRVALTLTYTAGHLSQVTDRAGRSVSFTHVGDDLVSATDVLGQTETYAYDTAHNLTVRTDKRGKVWRNFYDAFDRWTGSQDPLGNTTSLFVDPVARQSVYVDKVGQSWRTEYTPANNPAAKVDPLGNRVQYTWDAAQNKTSERDARGFVTSMTYDAKNNLLSRTMPDGRTQGFVYEATFSRVTRQSETGLPTVNNTYDTAGRLLTRADGLGTTSYGYDPRGQLRTVTAPGTSVTTFAYTPFGNVSSVTDATNRVTTLGYDTAGHLTSSTDGNNDTRTMEVDARGQVQALVDALGRRTEFDYDAAGNRVASRNAANFPSSFVYDDNGRLVQLTDALGNTSRTQYDAEGRVIASIDARGFTRRTVYDAAGRVSQTIGADGATTTVAYCADVGEACATIDAEGNLTEKQFDNVGRVTELRDALGQISRMTYDTAGRLRTMSGPGAVPTTYTYALNGTLQATASPALAVAYTYDARGNRLTVNANGATTRYTYDLANRLLTETNPLTRVTTYTYDAAGNRQTKLDANGRTTTYVYDENRRLLETRFFDGTQYTFAYDTRGNRTLERSPSHERALSYDELGRVSSVNDVTLGRTLQYAYDASGNRTRLQNGSLVYTYAYDGEGRLSAANGPGGSVQLSYDALSRRRVLSRSNGVNTHYSYDAVGQVQDVVHERGQAVLARFAYTYSDGNRTSKTNASGDVEAYGYDSDRRLIQVNYGTDRVVSYSLSGIGNRSSMDDVRTVAGQTYSTSYTYNGFNQLLSSNASCTGTGCPARVVTGFAYDNNGNLLTETVGTTTVRGYTWDADNRLRSLTTPGGLHQYQYDANGLRTQQVTPTGVTKYVLDGASVLEELDAGNQQKAHYLTNPQGIDDIFAFTQGSSTYFPLMDALGSVYAVSNSSGQVTRSYGYDVYGERTNVSGASPELAFGFTGREHDASGLNYNRDRYLDVRVGRWHQPDRAQDGASYYEYARGMPSLAIDPSGQFSTGAPITLGRAAVRAVPAFDSWTSTALNHPLLFLALIASLGIVSDDVVREANQLCPEDRDGIIEFHRGEEEARAVEVARTQSFRSVGFGLGESHEFGAALYLSRDYEVGVRYAKRAAARVGRGALIWVTISNAIWQIVRKHPGVRDGIGIAGETGEQTVVPLGPPLDLFDFSSGKMILERYGRYSR